MTLSDDPRVQASAAYCHRLYEIGARRLRYQILERDWSAATVAIWREIDQDQNLDLRRTVEGMIRSRHGRAATEEERLGLLTLLPIVPPEAINRPGPSDPLRQIARGAEYPFDAPDDGVAPMAVDWAVAAARGILADLSDRRGIKYGFREIDADVRVEIVSSLAAICREARAIWDRGERP